MLVDEIEGDEVADPVIERGRAFEIAEQKSQAQDLEALADGECVGPVDVAKGLIGEEALRVENGLASLQEAVQRLIRYPHSRQHATIAAVVQGYAQRPGAKGQPLDGDLHVFEDHGQVLAFARLLARDLEELGRVRHWVEDDQRAFRQSQGEDGPFSWRQVDAFERDLPQQLLQIRRKIDARTPEDLTVIFGRGQFVRTVGRDLAHARAYREGHLDQVVERRLVARGAEGAMILRPIEGLRVLRLLLAEITPAQLGHMTFHDISKMPRPTAFRSAPMTSSSPMPSLAARSSALILLRAWSGASRTMRSSSAATSSPLD